MGRVAKIAAHFLQQCETEELTPEFPASGAFPVLDFIPRAVEWNRIIYSVFYSMVYFD